ncbi:hypothetical protein F442_08608, partial [Phytophthora nicotianae P10297]
NFTPTRKMECPWCQAAIVVRPPDPAGANLVARRLCACCEQLLDWDAFAVGPAGAAARRCIVCANGPHAVRHWQRGGPPAPPLSPAAIRLAVLQRTMRPRAPAPSLTLSPAPPPAPHRRRRHNWVARRRKNREARRARRRQRQETQE